MVAAAHLLDGRRASALPFVRRGAFVIALLLPVLAVASSPSTMQYELFPYRPAANAKAMLTLGNARITMLTDRLFQFEYSSSGKFEDGLPWHLWTGTLKMMMFPNSRQTRHLATLPTSQLRRARFPSSTQANVFDSSLRVTAPSFSWHYGMTSEQDPGNLRGTFRTLDGTTNVTLNCTLNKKEHCEYGIISRRGGLLLMRRASRAWMTFTTGGRTHRARC